MKKYIVSGPPSSGKSSLIEALKAEGYSCHDEIARQVIAEQLKIEGTAVPWKDHLAFAELLFERMVKQQNALQNDTSVHIFDRSIPDFVSYLIKDKLQKLIKGRRLQRCPHRPGRDPGLVLHSHRNDDISHPNH